MIECRGEKKQENKKRRKFHPDCDPSSGLNQGLES